MKTCRALFVGCVVCSFSLGHAAVLTVTNTADSGPGSFRQAILDANATPDADTINFNTPGSGVRTIAPLTPLPVITNTLAIDGYSQPGSSPNTLPNGGNATLLIRLDGYNLTNGFPTGLSLSNANGSSVRGLVVVRFSSGIGILNSSDTTIAGNWIGLDVDGIARGSTNGSGVVVTSAPVDSATNITIGGRAPEERNVVCGWGGGVSLNAAHSFVLGNFIGTDSTGTLPRGNRTVGLSISGTNNTVGGPLSGAGNVISATTGTTSYGSGYGVIGSGLIQGNFIGTDVSGTYNLGNFAGGISTSSARIVGNCIANNGTYGIEVGPFGGSIIEGNFIGTDPSGTRAQGNGWAGIMIRYHTNRIGGLAPGAGNVIQFNSAQGVAVTNGAFKNEISGNRIYNNGGLGIDLVKPPFGVSTNDLGDLDTGPNQLQNFPVITNVVSAYGTLLVQGWLNSYSNGTFRLEFFASPPWDVAGIPEGQNFLGWTNVTTDDTGNAAFTAVLPTLPPDDHIITATATDTNGNTSEFSAGALISLGPSAPALLISGDGGTQTIAWPAATKLYQLEAAESLTPPVQWQSITSGIVEMGSWKNFTVTNTLGITNQFFRLRKL